MLCFFKDFAHVLPTIIVYLPYVERLCKSLRDAFPFATLSFAVPFCAVPQRSENPWGVGRERLGGSGVVRVFFDFFDVRYLGVPKILFSKKAFAFSLN